ncbi:acyltransferase family protein [Ramlibacter tataouinensis]|uniref:Candidate membrane protein n=1 Tax=Ramlibacter tataouinensis (strain ATCC BAA-407 / DSM 14655 / LMG 21543 / TTB310) TaxID=365046 RepID=F5Y3D4_RAMTT|nr:acyltransferase family protein [Ramlibacter tataouinensis]AEG91221.1 candidate membrane protein [Ramlibacter tataouinensis TTB310]
MPRRHDIDALRALAFGGVILYHLGMYYVAGWDWHLKSAHAAGWLQWPMRALNLWRMDLVFLVSGVSLALLQRRQPGAAALLRERSWRLLLPLAFGMAAVVPYQAYAQGVAKGLVAPGFGAFLLRYFSGGPWPAGAFDGAHVGITWNHLWFLPYLWLYTALVLAAGPWLRSAAGRRLRAAFTGSRGVRLLLLPALPLLAWSLLLFPHFPPTRDLVGDLWLHAVYFTLFLYGWWIGLDAGFWAEARRLRRTSLGLALALLVLYLALRAGMRPAGPLRLLPRLAGDLYAWAMLLAILGWACHALDRPRPWLAWASESVYPWYVLHQTLIILLAVQLAPWRLGPIAEPLLLLAGTVAGCWAATAVIRRSRWLRPLFGLKPQAASAASMSPDSFSGLSRGA